MLSKHSPQYIVEGWSIPENDDEFDVLVVL
jgi:hypothetical protein